MYEYICNKLGIENFCRAMEIYQYLFGHRQFDRNEDITINAPGKGNVRVRFKLSGSIPHIHIVYVLYFGKEK